ncbi:hypothetical protein CHS0354_002884 [Potamilus streckersoni]|uniref:Uncharacterized protein n=1 Tax=Potamilus streckersoni TaxID=2493646 RepID=A0AAE0SNS2_9BIVA|nr:hypothetical protein CHS0354_002884 [Potamilus streckersoni]
MQRGTRGSVMTIVFLDKMKYDEYPKAIYNTYGTVNKLWITPDDVEDGAVLNIFRLFISLETGQ